MSEAFAGKEVIIGEVGWPSAGRMREGALPSPLNQARVISEVLAHNRRDNIRVNVIEAFDQPWKRALEGTVGGHWGVLGADSREIKFVWGGAVSNHPFWRWQAAGGVVLALITFAAAGMAARRPMGGRDWLTVAAIALGPGILAGWAVVNVPLESLGPGGWLRSLALLGVALAAPVVTATAVGTQVPIPSFAQLMARAPDRLRDRLAFALGAVLIATGILALERALSLTFNPRYIDFAFAPLTAAALPYLVLVFATPARGRRGTAEVVMAGALALCAVYIAFNESFANWQALWCSAALLALSITLLRVRSAPGSA